MLLAFVYELLGRVMNHDALATLGMRQTWRGIKNFVKNSRAAMLEILISMQSEPPPFS